MTQRDRHVGRRRGAALERAILDAAADVLRESGYAGMTMDRVARRAATNKNAIYRRWPHRSALGVAAYRHVSEAHIPVPDTGTLRGDALELLGQANATWSSPHGTLLRDLLAAAAEDPRLLELLREQAAGGAMDASWLTVLSRAVARGEVAPETVRPRLVTLPVTLLRGEYALRGTPPVPDSVLVEIVDEVFLPLTRVAPGRERERTPPSDDREPGSGRSRTGPDGR